MSKINLTAKSGDWRWAGAMLYSGHRIRLETWADDRLYIELRPDGFIYWGGTDDTYGGVIAKSRSGLLWELYEPPAPAPSPPEPVRWKLEWCNGELSYTTPYGLRSYARGLMFRRWPGLRFGSFCAHPAPGVAWKTGTISTVYWHPGDASFAFCYAPTEYCDTPVDADEVEMIPVGGGK